MLKSSARPVIRLRGVRQNNLKNFDLDLPLNRLVVITGLSGSGKSSLAFDTLFAEGQRRYIETFSPYARQFFDRMDKPQVDSIEGIPPAIAIEQRNAVRTTRSTVGTMTEICDYMKALWPHMSQLHCRQCGKLVRKDPPQRVWEEMQSGTGGEVLVTFDLPLTEKLSLEESLALIAKQGYQRILAGGEIIRLDDVISRPSKSRPAGAITVIQDRLTLTKSNRARFIEACEQAYHFGKGRLAIRGAGSTSGDSGPKTQDSRLFSNRLHCAECDIEYREPSPALFSFNNPVGACPECKGFGRVISIDYDLAIPDRSRTLAQGVVRPWLTGHGLESQNDMMRMCRQLEIPTDVPFERLAKKWQDWIINGEPDYGKDEEHEWPRAWYGVKGYFRWLESKAYKMHVRVMLSRYRAYTSCPTCHGDRFQPETLLYRIGTGAFPSDGTNRAPLPGPLPFGMGEGGDKSAVGLNLADFYRLPIRDALALVRRVGAEKRFGGADPLGLALGEVESRLGYLEQVGLGYLTLDRPTRSLSGGETERVNLTTCLGTRLVNTLFVLDEPSVGLHPRDTERLVRILEQLRDAGNTVVVVEHEALVMRAADQIVDLGPGHGASGGQLVFQGPYEQIVRVADSLTGQYLAGEKSAEASARRPVSGLGGRAECAEESVHYGTDFRLEADDGTYAMNDAVAMATRAPNPVLRLSGVSRHNLKDVSVEIPLARFVCVTGVSGSGKTTLVREVLLPALEQRLRTPGTGNGVVKASERMDDTGTVDSGGRENGNGTEDPSSQGYDAAGENEKGMAALEGWESLGRVVLVDQSILGKTPRSNPAVYIGAFDDIREVFAQSDAAQRRGLNASAFSFNSAQGQCERCRGAGFEKIEMQFLSDVFVRCPDCDGRRYRQHILDVKIRQPGSKAETKTPQRKSKRAGGGTSSPGELSIADALDATVDEVIDFLSGFGDSRPAQRAAASLRLLQEVGLGYLRLGQPINTLSGGESQRLKLVRHLAESRAGILPAPRASTARGNSPGFAGDADPVGQDARPTLFLFDEPTTGLHFDDVRVLLKVFQRLVDAGHSVVVIEHNLDVIRSADWIVDLGPEAGDQGGRIVAQGTPEQIAASEGSQTGRALREQTTTKRAGKRPHGLKREPIS